MTTKLINENTPLLNNPRTQDLESGQPRLNSQFIEQVKELIKTQDSSDQPLSEKLITKFNDFQSVHYKILHRAKQDKAQFMEFINGLFSGKSEDKKTYLNKLLEFGLSKDSTKPIATVLKVEEVLQNSKTMLKGVNDQVQTIGRLIIGFVAFAFILHFALASMGLIK